MYYKDQTSSSCVYIQPQDIPTFLPVTLPLKSMYFQVFCKNYCPKTIEATLLKKVPKDTQ